MTEKCPACGKEFYVLYPNQWAYKWKQQHVCTWGCLRKLQKQDEPKGDIDMDGQIVKIKHDERMHAVNIAIEGENPYPYLESLGVANPTAVWYSIKKMVKKNFPELYKKLPKRVGMSPVESGKKARAVALAKMEKEKEKIRKLYEEEKAEEPAQEEPKTAAEAMKNMKDAADDFFGKALQQSTFKPVEIEKPMMYDGFTVREVEGSFARYRRSDINEKLYIDVELADGCDTLSYTVEQWRTLRQEFDRAAAILGVEL